MNQSSWQPQTGSDSDSEVDVDVWAIEVPDSPLPSPSCFEPECQLTEKNSTIYFDDGNYQSTPYIFGPTPSPEQTYWCLPPNYAQQPLFFEYVPPQVRFNQPNGESVEEVPSPSPSVATPVEPDSDFIMFPIKTAEEFDKFDEILGERDEEWYYLVSFTFSFDSRPINIGHETHSDKLTEFLFLSFSGSNPEIARSHWLR